MRTGQVRERRSPSSRNTPIGLYCYYGSHTFLAHPPHTKRRALYLVRFKNNTWLPPPWFNDILGIPMKVIK
jgi:hypothetical protein